MTRVEMGQETEGDRGWTFIVRIESPEAGAAEHELHLAYADYDHWSRGIVPPADIARRAVEYVLARRPASILKPRFDAATLRRLEPGLDAAMRGADG